MLGTITDVRIKYELQKKELEAKELNKWLIVNCKDSIEFNRLKKQVQDRLAI